MSVDAKFRWSLFAMLACGALLLPRSAAADFSQISVSGACKGMSFVGEKTGYSFTQSGTFTVFLDKTTDGLAFKNVPLTGIPATAMYSGMRFVDENTGFITSVNGPAANCVYKTSDGGKTWAAKSCGVTGTLRPYGMSWSSTKTGAIVGILDLAKPYVGLTTDGGETWKPVTATMPFLSGLAVAVLSPTHLVVTGNYDPGGGSPLVNAAWLTRDGGTTWKKVRDGLRYAGSYDFLSATTGYMYQGCTGAGAATNTCIVKTTDGGDTWTAPSTANINIDIAGMAWADELHGMLSGREFAPATGPAVMLTADGGKTWTKEKVPVQSDGYICAAYPGPSAYAGSGAPGAKGGVNAAASGGPRPPLADPGTSDAGIDGGATDAAADSAVFDAVVPDAVVTDAVVTDTAVSDAMTSSDTASPTDAVAASDSGAADSGAAPSADPGSSDGCTYQSGTGSRGALVALLGLVGLLTARGRRRRA